MLFQAFTIKDKTFPSNVVQGPLAGYSCAPFRRLFWRYGGLGFAVSEMISSNDILHREARPTRYLLRDSDEQFTVFQIAGNQLPAIAKATEIVSKAGADMVDLNCGCPVKKIRSKGQGSKLLEDPQQLFAVVQTIKSHTDALVSVKIRIPKNSDDFSIFAALEAIEKAGADCLIVHGRHWTERYDVESDIAEIAHIVQQTKLPVIANGDAADTQSLKKIYEGTGAQGVMVARAGVGQPWLFAQMKAECEGMPFTRPSLEKQGHLFLEHLEYLMQIEGEKTAVLQGRKCAKYYARYIENRNTFVKKAQQANTFSETEALVQTYFT